MNDYKKIYDKVLRSLINGSRHVSDYINLNIPLTNSDYVEDLSINKDFSSDLYLKYKNLHCLIQIKNKESKIDENDIEEFDMKIFKNKKYNCGIFISLSSKFTSNIEMNNFNIENFNNKTVIYLSKVLNSLDNINLALKLLLYKINITDNNKDNYSKFEWNTLKNKVE